MYCRPNYILIYMYTCLGFSEEVSQKDVLPCRDSGGGRRSSNPHYLPICKTLNTGVNRIMHLSLVLHINQLKL